MATTRQLVNYLIIYKARCRKMRHQGRLVKAYEVKGTPEYEEVKKTRTALASLLGLLP